MKSTLTGTVHGPHQVRQEGNAASQHPDEHHAVAVAGRYLRAQPDDDGVDVFGTEQHARLPKQTASWEGGTVLSPGCGRSRRRNSRRCRDSVSSTIRVQLRAQPFGVAARHERSRAACSYTPASRSAATLNIRRLRAGMPCSARAATVLAASRASRIEHRPRRAAAGGTAHRRDQAEALKFARSWSRSVPTASGQLGSGREAHRFLCRLRGASAVLAVGVSALLVTVACREPATACRPRLVASRSGCAAHR